MYALIIDLEKGLPRVVREKTLDCMNPLEYEIIEEGFKDKVDADNALAEFREQVLAIEEDRDFDVKRYS